MLASASRRHVNRSTWIAVVCCFICLCPPPSRAEETVTPRRLLYVASPGVRNYLEYGGHGVIVFDIDNGHKFVKSHSDGRRR